MVAASQEGQGLELVEVTYTLLDSDGDGLEDSVRVNATVHNANETRSWTYLVAAFLISGEDQLDLETRSGLLDSGGEVNVTLLLTCPSTAPAGTFEVMVELHVQDLSGDLFDTDLRSIGLSPLGEYEVSVMANRTTVEATENTSVTFRLNLTSASNNPTEVTLNVTSPSGWVFELEADRVLLDPGATAFTGLVVRVPHNEPPGTRETLNVLVRAVRDKSAIDIETLTVVVTRQVFKLDLELDFEQIMMVSGQTVTVPGTVTNLGNNRDSVDLEVTAPTGWSWEFEPPGLDLDRGTSGGFLLHLTAPVTSSGSGAVQIDVTAVSMSITIEDTHDLTVTFNMGDLAISSANVTVSPPSPAAGEEVTLQARVSNLGPIELSDVDVALVVEGEEVARTTIPKVPVAGIAVATLAWTPGPGSHLLRVIVDPDARLGEVDRDNNVASLTITVLSPDLAVHQGDVTTAPEYPTEGTDVTFTVRVLNLGTALAGPFDVEILVDGVEVALLSIDAGLAPGSNVTVDHTWPSTAGRHTVEVVLDPAGVIRDRDTSNNNAARSFSVNARPVAAVNLSASVVDVGSPLGLDATASSDPDGRVRQYYFDYGDGSDSGWIFSPTVDHTYSNAGEYEVHVFVRDEAGAQCKEPAVATLTVESVDSDGGGDEEGDLVLWALVGAFVIIALLMIATLLPRLRGPR